MSIIGKPAPYFSADAAKEGEVVTISLDDYKGKWLILLFYPLDFTFVCPTEIVAFSDAADTFAAHNAEILGCSVDSADTHLAWMRTPRSQAGVGELNFPLLSDLSKQIAAAYDVLDNEGVKALRGVFIIDPEGVIQSATINNFDVGRSVDGVFRTLRGYQHAAETGNVCPANWQDGQSGMEMSLDGVKATIG